MKNRKRVLAMLLAGFLSVTTAFQTSTVTVFATENVESSSTTEASLEASTEDSAETDDEASDEGSTESTEEATDEASTETTEDATEESSEEASDEASTESTEEVEDEKTKITDIKDVVAATEGEFTVKGVVTYVSGKNVYVQDETGAICIYLAKADKSIVPGVMLTATGTRQDYNGLLELSAATVVEMDADNTVDYGFTTFAATELKDLVEEHDKYECQKVFLEGVTVDSITADRVYVAGGDSKVLIYAKGVGSKFEKDFPVGTVVNIFAVVSDYKGIQLILTSDADHKEIEKAAPADDVVTVDDSVVLRVAGWAGTALAGHDGEMELYGDAAVDNDCADSANVVTAVKGGSSVSPVYKDTNNNYNIGSTGFVPGDYYQFEISGKGFGLYNFGFTTRGSNTGAKNWKVSYSADGETFVDAGKYVVGTKNAEYSFKFADSVMHVDKLTVRLEPTDKVSIKGAEVGKTGVNRVTSVVVNGSPVIASDITGYVVITPAAGEACVGQEITLESSSKDATIYYTINGGEEQVYNADSKPQLVAEDFITGSELDVAKKATVVAYAKLEGKADSIKNVCVYTQAQCATVKASPNGGAVKANTVVTLSTTTEGATILYSMDEGATWITYEAPFKLEKLPAKVMAKATLEGMLDSNVATVEFTQRMNDEYNIYFGQLHSHTSYSDGAGTAREAFSHASTEVDNLDFLAVTDHSNSYDNDKEVTITDGSKSSEWVEGHELAKEFTSEKFVGLFGYEMTWSGGAPGHMNTFNTNGFMSRNMPGYESQSRTALQNYYAQIVSVPESISMFNHPGTTFGDFYDFAYYNKANDRQISLIEVGNGEGAIGSAGYFPSYEYYTRALDKGWHVAPANNQDNHKGRWGDANTGRTVVLADSLTEENIYDALRNMRVYATEDNDLHIYYTLNGQDMGTTLDEKPEKVNIKVKTSDATDSSMMTVEVICNGGVSVASKQVEEASAETTFELNPDYAYYYIKITQADGNIAVTAPIWLSDVEAVGIGSLSTDASLCVAGDDINLNAVFYNNEASDFEISSIVYTASGEVIHTTNLSETFSKIESQKEVTDSFVYHNDEVGKKNIEVTLLGYLNGASKKYTASLDLTYISPDMVTHVIVDGTHSNDYVSGYYGGNVGNFADIAAKEYVKVDVVNTEITKEMLDNCSVLVISAPAKKSGTFGDKSYKPTHFEDSFIELVKEYVAEGGNLVLCGIADYQDTKDGQSSTEINKLAEAIGATSRLNSDEIVDNDKNGGQEYRLYFTNFNRDSKLLKGVSSTQEYSAYSACSVLVDADAVAKGTAEALVYGHSTTYTKDCKQFDNYYVEVPKGSVVAAAREDLVGGGQLIMTGTVFLSDFEVKSELDYGGQEYYANRNILLNFLEQSQKKTPVSTIAELRKGEPGQIFTVEGYVTAGTAVEGNKFFDTIYIQDETAGTTVFPIADAGIELGTKIRVTGFVDGYQGDSEIQIYSYKILDEEKKVIEPKKVTTAEAADYSALGGSLLKVQGKVTRVVTNTSGVDYFYVVDDSGVEARVFIDGYILASDGNDTVAEDAVVGNIVSAVGLSYYNPDGACLRVRDRAEIELVSTGVVEKKATIITKWGTSYIVDEDGNPLTGFQTVDGVEYYTNTKGAIQKGTWLTVDGKKYYAKADGAIAKNETITKWGTSYVLGADGVLETGFFTFDGMNLYANANGAVQKGTWITVGDDKYYAKADGQLANNEIITKWITDYAIGAEGTLVTGFVTLDGKDLYANEKGVIQKSAFFTVDGKKYYAKADGQIAKNETFVKWFHKYTADENGVITD